LSRSDINAVFRSGWIIFAGPLMLNSAVYFTTDPAPAGLTSMESKAVTVFVFPAELDVVLRQFDDLIFEGLALPPEL
jgi:hypothetical protein